MKFCQKCSFHFKCCGFFSEEKWLKSPLLNTKINFNTQFWQIKCSFDTFSWHLLPVWSCTEKSHWVTTFGTLFYKSEELQFEDWWLFDFRGVFNEQHCFFNFCFVITFLPWVQCLPASLICIKQKYVIWIFRYKWVSFQIVFLLKCL